MAANFFLLVSLVGWWYFIRHRRLEGEKIGLALGIALIWILIALSRPVSLWFEDGWSLDSNQMATIEEGNPINRNVAFGFLLVGTLILIRRNANISEFISNNPLLICLYAYCLVSIIWSDVPFVAFKRWFRHLSTVILVLVFLTDQRGFRSVKIVFRYAAYILLPASIVLFKYYPRLGRHYHPHSGEMMVTGVTTGKNALGVLCMISALFLLVEVHRRFTSGDRKSFIFKGDLCLLGVSLYLLHASRSATSEVALLGGALIYLGLGTKWMRRARSPWMFRAVLIITLLVPLTFYGVGLAGADTTFGSLVDFTGHSETFWGRTVLWKEVIDRVPNALFGSGYETFWLGDRLEELWNLYWWKPNEAHNGFVGVYASIGLVGVAILVGVIVQSYRRLFGLFTEDHNNEYARIGLAVIVAALLYNVTEYAFLGLANMWLLFLLVSIRLSSARAEAIASVESPEVGEWISA